VTLEALTPDDLKDAGWAEVEALYRELRRGPDAAGGIEPWLARWSRLDSCLTEAASLAMIAYTCDTTDSAKEQAHLRFSSEILPRAEEQGVALARILAESGYSTPDLEVPLARFRTAIEIFREENVPLFAELEELSAAYQRVTGGMSAEWEGERLPLPMLAPHLQAPDREVRERAWRASTAPYLESRETMAGIFDRMYALRQQVARQAGFADYRDYSFRSKCRFDYTPADCERFHAAVEATVVPAIERLLALRRERLGLGALRPWDLGVDPWGDDRLRPFEGAGELAETSARVLRRVDHALADQFGLMIREGLLDLGSRAGKAPGGYCDTLHFRGRPFIFMNASGVMEDVTTLLHEAGHCFHAFAAHRWPLIWQRHPGSESAELASMSLELLAAPHLGPPDGFLDEVGARRARLAHLEDILLSLAHIAAVDAFQTWIYTGGHGHDAEARDAAWLAIRQRFEAGVDWSGLESERIARWYRQLHVFLYPFYYIEYGIAQLGALQVWRNSLEDPEGALRAYRRFLGLGATRPLPALYEAAGAALVFDAGRMGELVGLVESEITALVAGLGEVARG
jgi:oligoendopeptidase F